MADLLKTGITLINRVLGIEDEFMKTISSSEIDDYINCTERKYKDVVSYVLDNKPKNAAKAVFLYHGEQGIHTLETYLFFLDANDQVMTDEKNQSKVIGCRQNCSSLDSELSSYLKDKKLLLINC
jgi:hypothetical protein